MHEYKTRAALGRPDRRAAGGDARPHGQPRLRATRPANCPSATTPAISTRRRRTRSPRGEGRLDCRWRARSAEPRWRQPGHVDRAAEGVGIPSSCLLACGQHVSLPRPFPVWPLPVVGKRGTGPSLSSSVIRGAVSRAPPVSSLNERAGPAMERHCPLRAAFHGIHYARFARAGLGGSSPSSVPYAASP